MIWEARTRTTTTIKATLLMLLPDLLRAISRGQMKGLILANRRAQVQLLKNYLLPTVCWWMAATS
jgi:hypothetical protein